MKKYVYKLKGLLFISVIFSVINAVINAAMLLFPGLLIDNYKKGLPYIQKMLFIPHHHGRGQRVPPPLHPCR